MSNISIAILASILASLLFVDSSPQSMIVSEKAIPKQKGFAFPDTLASIDSVFAYVDTTYSWVDHDIEPVTFDLSLPTILTDTVEIESDTADFYTDNDTPRVKKNPNKRITDATTQPYVSPMYLQNPANFKVEYELEENIKGYSIYERIGDSIRLQYPSRIDFNDYLYYRQDVGIRNYFRELSSKSNEELNPGLLPSLDLGPLADIFGGGPIEIRPTGYATLSFGVNHQRTNNPALTLRQQRNTTFDFDQQIELGVQGQIGERMRLNLNFNTGQMFDFQNQLKLRHEGTEDQIVQSVEAGNVSMQLGNSLIQGRQNLFGLKTQLKFGPVLVTLIGSNERGQRESITVSGGGAVETPFEKEVADYDMNRHFFLSHFFRSRYETALENLPIINSTIRINRVEVWMEKNAATHNTRNAVGFVDLGENNLPTPGGGNGTIFNTNLVQPLGDTRFPDNDANNLYNLVNNNTNLRVQKDAPGELQRLGFENTLDFEIAGNLRRLNPNEYEVNTQLGYISLNQEIPSDQVLFVAFNYTVNGQSYQVGEFSDDKPSDGLNSNVIFLKMLKSSVLRVQHEGEKFPLYDLMMKNIYRLDAYGISEEGFFLDVKYESGTSAGRVNFLPEGSLKNKPLIQVLNVDRLTNNTAPGADNFFDFIPNRTIVPEKGLIIFPVLEPFGSHLAQELGNPDDSARYVFQALYDDTQQGAIQNHPQQNKFLIEGYYRSAGGSEIPLNSFNLAPGSVVVTAGGRRLTEGSDYRVDEMGGKLIILNEAVLSSGAPIEISYENAQLFTMQNKTMLGTRVELDRFDNFRVGATLLNLREQPFNFKTTLGDEPINNTLWGMDLGFQHESDFITRLIDRIPLISTKETSTINFSGEFANFIPGQPGAVKNDQERGFVYIDDFEAAKTEYQLSASQRWQLASFPEGGPLTNPTLDPVNQNHPQAQGFTRAKLSWYRIDQTIYQGSFGIEIPQEDFANNYTRRIRPEEIFPQARRAFGNNFQNTFDMRYRPTVRGPYNYQTRREKLNPDGSFTNPDENWAGIMQEIKLNTNDFEAANVEFIEFWLMDPYMDDPSHQGGKFYINLGLISEDVLPDQSLSRENGLPTTGVDEQGLIDTTEWGIVPLGNTPTDFFSAEDGARERQDIGLDGLDDEQERNYFNQRFQFIDNLRGYLSPEALAEIEADPSTDNFRHFRDSDFEAEEAGILERYQDFNGTEGNSPVGVGTQNFTLQSTNLPDTEDLNENGSLNFAEQYWQYEVDLRPQALVPGSNFVVDSIRSVVSTGVAGSNNTEVTWYQFRIPIVSGSRVNNIPDFKSINFMRMYLTGFEEEVVLRLAEFQFVATQWRRYLDDLRDPQQAVNPPEPPFADFEVGSVSIEENSEKLPFNYRVPPGIIRQSLNGNTQPGFLQDERSLLLKTCNLEDGDARAVFKTVRQDLRQYKNLKLWVHAEAVNDAGVPSNFFQRGDATVFIRLGLDNDLNYYEYELPLQPSDPTAGAGDVNNVWANEIDFILNDLSLAKGVRDSSEFDLNDRFEFLANDTTGAKIYIKGTPKLSDIRNIMIGVRNPRDPGGRPICIEMWINELRLTNFDKKGGWATNANVNMRLADLGTINANFRHRTQGFGPLEQRITSRPLDNEFQYSINATLNFDKFFPKNWGLQLPISGTYGERRSRPVFNPQEADVRTDLLVRRFNEQQKQDSVWRSIEDYSRYRSISFNNWRKIKTDPQAKQHFYDIENLDFTFYYNEQYSRNSIIARQITKQHSGQVNYRYSFVNSNWQPFKNAKFPLLRLINFSPLPTSLDIRVGGDRFFEERLLRPSGEFGGISDPVFNKNFLINRQYNLVWNLTQNLLLNFSANNQARVDEVKGRWSDATQRQRDSVGTLMENLLHIGKDPENGHDQYINFGRTIGYTHNLSLTYRLPFNEFPLLNWVNGNVNYTSTFRWDQPPEINPSFGGTISNTQQIQLNGRLNLSNLYRKIKPLGKILDGGPPQQQRQSPLPPRRNQQGQDQDEDEKEKNPPTPFEKFAGNLGKEILRIIFSVKNADLTYSKNSGTVLPGYLPRTDNFGLDFGYEDTVSGTVSPIIPPTVGFVFGSQEDIRPIARENFWITQDPTLSNLYMEDFTEQISGRATIELFRVLRINLNFTRDEARNRSEFFRWDPDRAVYDSFDPYLTGNFRMSYIFANTAFEKNEKVSKVFEEFSENREIISRRLAEQNPNAEGLGRQIVGDYRNGYTGTQQDVLIPALLSAYGVTDPEKVSLSAFPKIPLPNWSIDFNGLSQLPFIQEYFTAVTLRHTYRATYTVGTFNNNINAELGANGFVSNTDTLDRVENIENFFAENNITAVQITEQFAPLLGVNLTMKNGMTASIDYKRGRQLNFSTGSLQLAELRTQDLSIAWGLRRDELNLQLNLFGKEINLQNSVHFQFALTMRDTRERNRILSQDGDEPSLPAEYTRGTRNWQISPSVDYVLNRRINATIFFEQSINEPWTSSSYKVSRTRGGFRLQFMLAN